MVVKTILFQMNFFKMQGIMKEYTIVTTALEETWPDDKQSVLFLGEWCRLYSRKHRWEKMDAEVLEYPWDDRVKLYQNYQSQFLLVH